MELEAELEAQEKLEQARKAAARRQQLRVENAASAVTDSRKAHASNKSLKSDLKRSAGFVKKVRALSEASAPALCKDIKELKLTRYISEVVNAVVEVKLKTTDVAAAVDVCSMLHHRYPDFSEALIQGLLKEMEPQQEPPVPPAGSKPSDPDPEIVRKQRVVLRFLTELYIVGLITDVDVLFDQVLRIGSKHERGKNVYFFRQQQMDNMTLLAGFVRHAGQQFLGVTSAKQKAADTGMGSVEQIVPADVQQKFLVVAEGAYERCCRQLLNEHQNLCQRKRANKDESLFKGEVREDHEKKQEESERIFERMFQNATSLSDGLDKPMPELPQEEEDEKEDVGLSLWENTGRQEGLLDGPFEDEDSRVFYTELPPLQSLVPASVLGLESMNADEESAADAGEEEIVLNEDDAADAEADDADREAKKSALEEDPLDPADKPQHQMVALLASLEDCVNRDRADKFSLDFCHHNSKGNRRRLVKTLYDVPRQSLELIPNYARIVASLTLEAQMKEVGSKLVEALDDEFYYLLKKAKTSRLETRLRNIRFIAELTKFKVAPPSVAFNALKKCLDDFSTHNIVVGATLLEHCGRFLYLLPHTHEKLSHQLDVMMNFKKAKKLDPYAENMIANAFFQCKPPERKARQQKEYPPMYQYVRKLLFKDLKDDTTEKVLKILRRLPWQEKETEEYVFKCCTKVARHRNLEPLCDVLAGLNRYHDKLCIRVVDATLEWLQLGLESNDFRVFQRQVAFSKFLGTLYTYNLVNSALVFDVLYSFLNFGHSLPPSKESALGIAPKHDPRVPYVHDGPCHLARVQQICEILQVVGIYFGKGPAKQKLDRFLVFFQRYLRTKPVLPPAVEFAVLDLFEAICPKMKLFESWDEVQAKVEEYEAADAVLAEKAALVKKYQSSLVSTPAEVVDSVAGQDDDDDDDAENDDDDDDDDDDDGDGEDGEGDGGEDGDEAEADPEDEDEGENARGSDEDSDDGVRAELVDEDVVLRERFQAIEEEEDDEFERELKKMLAADNAAVAAAAALNTETMATLPMQAGFGAKPAADAQSAGAPPGGIQFRLAKRGVKGKTEFKGIYVPENTSLARNTRTQQVSDNSDIKRFILDYAEDSADQPQQWAGGDRGIQRVNNRPLGITNEWKRQQAGGAAGSGAQNNRGGKGAYQRPGPVYEWTEK